MKYIAPFAIAAACVAGSVHAQTDLNFSGKLDLLATQYGKDYFRCWNDGNAANCGMTPAQLEGEGFLRVDGVRELTDDLTLVFRGQTSMYINNAFYSVSKAAGGSVDYVNSPTQRTELEDTWVGLKQDRLGTLRLGQGLNPYMKALEGDGHTDLGGREMLELMVGYDSPYLIGEKSNGIKVSYAHYKGAHMRKEIKVFAAGEEAAQIHPVGNSLLIDGAWMGKLNARLAMYQEDYAARDYDGGTLDGVLDGAGNVIAGTGATAHSHGVAAFASYDFNSLRLGVSVSHNQRDKTQMVNPAYPSFAEASNVATVFASAWRGPWSLYTKVTQARFNASEESIPAATYDWLYPNSNFDVSQFSAELAYEYLKNTKLVAGYQWKKYQFKESPNGNGMCYLNQAHACYSPNGSQMYVGVRSNF